jgi:yersiniabactin nonribosomal peptide synthetase
LGGCSTHVYYEFISEHSPEKFYKALNSVISEQQMLRTIINSQGEEIVLDEVPYYSPEVYDWTDKSPQEIEELLKGMREKYSHEVMPSDEWPLCKFEFAKLPSGKYRLFASCDLLVVDAGSFALLAKELSDKYYEQQNDEEIGCFDEYLNLLEERKTKKKYSIDKKFWEGIADDIPPAPALPMVEDINGNNNIFKRKHYFIDSDIWHRVKEKLNSINVSASTGVLACYATVLGFRCNQDRFTLNLPMTNLIRRKKGMNRVMGDFTEEMLMPVNNYKAGESFEEYISYVNSEFMKYFKHSYFDGIELMSHIRSKTGETVKMPVVYTGMISDKSEFDYLDFFGEMVYGVSQTPQVVLDCQVFETHGQLKIVWDYIERLFDSEDINSMFEQFIKLIEAMADEKTQASEIVKISDNYAHELAQYNSTEKSIAPCTLAELFKSSVEKYPNRTFVSDFNGSLTYKETDVLSDKVAKGLIASGIKKGDRISIIGNRNNETIVNIIATVKIGAVFVPVNPQYPQERRNYIYENSNCICTLDGIKSFQSYSDEIISSATPSDTAYVIYTSGSTGTPKGVVISNDAVCNTIIDINQRFKITSDDKILSVSSFGFDLSIYDIFGAVVAGAEVVIARDNKDIHNLAELIEKHGITVWNSVPSIMELVTESHNDGYTNKTLKTVLLSGDWIPVSLPDKIKVKYPNAKVISLGGATEGSIWSIYYEIGNTDGMSSIPYGYPLGNQQMYLLDENGREVPCEAEAEICIGGRGVATGYDNNPEKTAEVFIEHEKYGRIYRTGDFGRMKRDGFMEFRGRRDGQVKIHGYRVELGEIESAIQKIDGIKKSVVDICKNDNNSYDILAYIVSDKKKNSPAELDMNEFNHRIEEFAENLPLAVSSDVLDVLNRNLEDISAYYMKKFFADYGDFSKPYSKINVEKFVSENGFEEKYTNLLTEWLEVLCEDGYVEKSGDDYVLLKTFEIIDTDELWNDFDKLDGSDNVKPLKEYIRSCCESHYGLFKGEIVPVSLFFHESSSDVAKTIYTDNPVSVYTNAVARKAITEIIKESSSKDRKVRILEVGAGIGGTSAELFGEIADFNVEYDFSDISEFFLNNASERFAEYDFINYKFLDINKDLQSQGCSYGEYDIVFGVNVIHDAENLDYTIENIKKVLKPNGYLAMIETTDNMKSQMVSLGFLEGLNPIYEDMRNENKKAFMDEHQWLKLLSDHGMTPNSVYIKNPDIKKVVWQNVIIGRNRFEFELTEEKQIILDLKKVFPDYMIPSKVFRIDEIPLTVNGKVDKNKLPKISYSSSGRIYDAPENEMQQKLAQIWENALGKERIGIKDNFFELGGDSLNAIKIVTVCGKEGISIQLADLYNYSTIEALSNVAVYEKINVESEELNSIDSSIDESDLSSILSEL